MTPSIECVGSTCFVDPEPLPEVRRAVCPACGQTVPIGGWPARYLVHREPGDGSAGVSGERRLVVGVVRPNGVPVAGASSTPAPPAGDARFPATFRGLGAS